MFVYQDLESSHGNNLRARTLFNEDEDLQEIFFINPLNQDGIDLIMNEWQFGQINAKKHIRYASKVEKEKPVYNRVSGEKSRASIPLFKLTHKKGYAHKNADYWSNVNDPINSLEAGDMEGSVDGKLIYVPISRYQIDCPQNVNWDLDKVYNLSKQIHQIGRLEGENEELAKLVVFGVRKADVKKLDKSNWVSFSDFMLDHYKKYVMDNKEVSSVCFKKMLTTEAGEDYKKIMEHLNPIENIFENDSVKLDFVPEGHVLHEVKAVSKILHNRDNSTQKASSATIFIAFHDRQWLVDTLDVEIDSESMAKSIQSAVDKYPLLSVISDTISYYGSITDHYRHGNLQTKLEDYINLCDNVEGGRNEPLLSLKTFLKKTLTNI